MRIDTAFDVRACASRGEQYLDAGTITVFRRHRTGQPRERLAAGNVHVNRDLLFSTEAGSPIDPDLFTDDF